MRGTWIAVGVALAVGAAIAFGLSSAGAQSSGAFVEEMVVDGVTVYRGVPEGDGNPLHSIHPLGAEKLALGSAAAYRATSADLAGCRLLAGRPGQVNDGCALLLAEYERGDLVVTPGAARIVYGVCGHPPGPGEVNQCPGHVVGDDDVDAARQQLRDRLQLLADHRRLLARAGRSGGR